MLKYKQSMKWLFFFFQTKKLVIHLIDDFHVMNVPTKPTDKTNAAIHMASSLPVIATRVNELGDSFNKGIIEQDTSSNIADSHNSREQPKPASKPAQPASNTCF